MVNEFRYLVKPPIHGPAGDFTLEAEAVFDGLGQGTMYSHYNAYTGNNRAILWDFIGGNQLRLILSKDGATYVSVLAPWVPNLGQLYRLAADRSGSVVKLWVDGVQVGGGILSGAIRNSADDQFVGTARNGTSVQNAFVGTIGGFQRVDGTALYQAGGYVPQPLPLWG